MGWLDRLYALAGFAISATGINLEVQRLIGMNLRDAALGMAGVIGCCVAVFHGILTQRLMVRPLEEFFLTDKRTAASVRRLVPLLLHFSTISWFLGGLALIAAANWFEHDARLATGLFVGSLYLFGALEQPLGNTRSPSRLDAHGTRAHSDRLRCQQIQRLKPYLKRVKPQRCPLYPR